MRKYLILIALAISFTATAEEIKKARKEVSLELKETVRELKTDLKAVDVLVTGTNKSVLILKDDAKRLRDRSGVLETNPTLMEHGQKSVQECTDNNKNIIWKNGEWICQSVELKVDCQPASDEYRYDEKGDGNFHCSKHPKDDKLVYYWKPAGYGTKCNSDITKEQVYYCYYDDRNANKVQVDDEKCTQSGAKKEPIPAKACESDWTVGGWSECSAKCGSGTQTRTVECIEGYNCSNFKKPLESQTCNTQSCSVNPTYTCPGGWSKSGNICKKNSKTCAFSGNTYVHKARFQGGASAASLESWVLNGVTIFSDGFIPYPDRRGTYEASKGAQVKYWYVPPKNYLSMPDNWKYQLCYRETMALQLTCPAGMVYNSGTRKCN